MKEVPVWKPLRIDDETTLTLVAGDSGVLHEIRFGYDPPLETPQGQDHPVFRNAASQLEAYFAGELKVFDLPLAPRGTDFQQTVWAKLLTIPYGQTRTYSQIAAALGSPNAVRAVGAANGRNPIPIVIPCHRVIGASGKLVGFGGGLPLKRKLLDLESPQIAFTHPKKYFAV